MTSQTHSSRPLSRTTIRTPVGRPSSSLSVRPTSSASGINTRPQSRFSQRRPHSRQVRSRLVPIFQTLVTRITGLEEDGEGDAFREKVDYMMKNLESTTMMKAAASVDMSVIDRQISGHALKARINSQDDFGRAMEVAYNQLKTHVEIRQADLDSDIKTAHVPDHLQFLLALSQPPSRATEATAAIYLDAVANPPKLPVLTWADILAEEPFEGEHWEGIYIPGGSRNTDYDSSEPSLSPLNSDDLALDDDESDSISSADFDKPFRPVRVENVESDNRVPESQKEMYSLEYRKQFEELRSRQYWRHDWHTDTPLHLAFDLGDPRTLGPTLNRVVAEADGFQDAFAMLKPERYISEEDMVRELLMALQGNRNIVLTWGDAGFQTTSSTPRLIHLSLTSQESIIHSLAKTATIVERLRRFTASVFSLSTSRIATNVTGGADNQPTYNSKKPRLTRTCEAFADAIDYTIRGLNTWCATREEIMCRASGGGLEEPVVVSLLHTETALEDGYANSFDVLLDIVRSVFRITHDESFDPFGEILERSRQSPAAQTAVLLDTLFAAVQRHMERGDSVTSRIIMEVFVRTAEPVWGMIGKWLKDGMGVGLGPGWASSWSEQDDEFFIEDNGLGIGILGLGLLDPEFWSEGYAVREMPASEDEPQQEDAVTTSFATRRAIPLFLQLVADLILGTGKAVGLLRALDTRTSFAAFEKWGSFSELVQCETDSHITGIGGRNTGLFSVSIDALSQTVYDNLLSRCQAVNETLVQIVVVDCALWKHLEAIEDLYLMRKGDAMSHFADIMFAKMDSQQPWNDFHFLNAAFNDVVNSNANAGSEDWIDPSLIRLSYRGGRAKDLSIKRTVKAIDGLVLEYMVPFPLIYIFQPKDLKAYNEVFNFLLQIRRAKSVLERILVRNVQERRKGLKDELKMFYAMRGRLSWIINTLLSFLTTYVIHAEVIRFHQVLRSARSLDEMIQIQNEHLGKICGRCLLKSNTAALHGAILSILDMCLHFSEGFITFAGDTTVTLDVSRQSLNLKRHRSKRQRQQRRNIIGFSQFLHESSEDEEEEGAMDVEVESFSVSALGISTMDGEGDFFNRVEKMSSELDGLVRFLRRGVESLAGGTSDAASTFGVLAFALEDWDI